MATQNSASGETPDALCNLIAARSEGRFFGALRHTNRGLRAREDGQPLAVALAKEAVAAARL